MNTAGMPDLRPEHRAIVDAILRAHLPRGASVWAFGSRVTGRARPYSDLDLAIDAGRRLDLGELAEFSDAFSNSDLPWKVDVIDWHAANPGFRAAIAADLVPWEADATG